MALAENDLAPDFSLQDSYGKKVSLHDFLGRWIVVYFYPQDETSGCTMEAIDFTKLAPEFEKAGAMILGISKDSCESHIKFVNHRKLGITLLSDPDASVNKLYDVWGMLKILGREFAGTKRTTFLVDPKGRIARIWRNVNPIGHASAVLEDVRGRKI
jgi:thioredoxin-dependent peroxiredoxin